MEENNTLQVLKEHIDTSVAAKTASSVLDRVFIEIKSLAAAEYSDKWLEEVLSIFRFSQDIEEGFKHSKAAMLEVVKDRWDDLPHSFRQQHGFTFVNFAKIWTGGKKKSTIDGYTATARIWVLNEYGKDKRVEIVDRSENGKPIIENGKVKLKTVEFCPYAIDLSKLAILNPRALRDDMTDKLWEMLVDDFYTCDDLRAEHNADKEDGTGPQYVIRYRLDGPGLFATQNGEMVCIASELNWEDYETNPLVKDGIDHFLKVLGVDCDEDIIYEMIRKSYKP